MTSRTSAPEAAPAFADATTEDAVKKGILVELSRRGFLVWRNNSGSLFQSFPAGMLHGRQVFYRGRLVQFGLEGSPDILGFCRLCGLLVAVEVKRPRGGVVSDVQLAFAAQVAPSGAFYGVARTVAQAVELADAHRSRCHR
jgi:hypothetical protein